MTGKILSKVSTAAIAGLLFILAPGISLQAQEFGYGFRAGLSYAKFSGDSEMDADGNNLDRFKNTSGFHIGVTFNYKITDLFGLRSELIFTQRGTEYEYDGESYFILAQHSDQPLQIPGIRKMTEDISTANLEIPLNAYYRLGALEISGGLNLGIMMAATSTGSIDFNGMSALTGNPVDPFSVNISANYNKDNARAGNPPIQFIDVDGTTYPIPSTLGGYYYFEEKGDNRFKTFDIGLMGGLSFFLNEGLYLGARVVYGLSDIDDNQYDISFRNTESNGDFIFRTDDNRSLTWQATLGFSF